MLSTVCSYDNNAAFASSAACCSAVRLVLGPGTVAVVLDDVVAEPGAALPPLHAANANAAAATTTDTPCRRPHTPCTRPPPVGPEGDEHRWTCDRRATPRPQASNGARAGSVSTTSSTSKETDRECAHDPVDRRG